MQRAVTGGANMPIQTVTIIGTGMMGNAIAMVFATSPALKVKVRAVEWVDDMYAGLRAEIAMMVSKGIYPASAEEEIISRISFHDNDEDAYGDADFVLECVPEIMSLKQSVMENVERFCPAHTILATNTSVMSVTEIFSGCQNKARVVGAHFWNPGHLIPLVEVVKTEDTAEDSILQTMELLRSVGKQPIYCKKDVPGFVANRLQHALWREAFYMVETGIADAKTVDDACKYGPGLRWPVLGPMENSDMVSIGLSYNIHDYILKHLADNHEPSKCLQEMLDAGKTGFASGSGWQDWTPEEAKASAQNLREYLMDYTVRQKENNK